MKLMNKRIISFLLALVMILGMMPMTAFAAEETGSGNNELAGKTISILGASISTYTGISNNPDYNSTIGNNAVYYTEGKLGVYKNDTWWMQVANDLGLELLVNNSWSGSSLLYERNGTVGAYVDRCVQLHNNDGEEPDIIGIQMGTNDFQYYKDTLGTADIDYAALITENEDGSYTYAEPTTSLEAAAIVLHKISIRYPDAEVYYLNISQRIDGTDELIRSFNAELKQVVEHFGAHIVDIYGSAITMADFDTYIGDGRVHPNCLGMDAYTEAFKRALLANTAYEVNTHTVSLDLNGVTADYGDDKIVVSGDAFSCKLTAEDGKELSVSVTMGGADITDTTYENGTISIESVTDDVVITSEATVHKPQNYRWEFDGTDLACVSGGNTLTKDSGTTTDGVFSKTSYTLKNEVVLMHDLPWAVEWKCEGTFLNTNGSSGARIFTSDNVNANYNARYIFKSNTNGIVAMGEKTSSGSHNYGIALGDYDIDWTALHTYRLENRIADDGSNMIYLLVDGEEIGPMNHYYIGTKDQNTTSDWLSGKDFVFPYMGTDTHGFTNASIDYIQVWEIAHTHTYTSLVTAPTCTQQGYTTYSCDCGESYVDNYVEATGHTYENGICTACGAEHPNLANFEGKVISILGGSNCTFAGYIPVADGFNQEHRSRYPDTGRIPDVTDVSQTWWMQLLTQMDAKLGINDSWAGSQVLNTLDSNSGDLGPDAAMASLTRIQNLGANGTPDVILFFGGCNDIGRGVTLGSFNPATAPAQADLTATKWDSFADAYVAAITRMQHFYPNARILVMLPYNSPTYFTASKVEKYGAVIRAICDHYGVDYVDLRDSGINSSHLPDNIHPNAEGSDYITTAVLDALLSGVALEGGEHLVHSVTHELTGAKSSLGYYKGISDGKSFVTTITGEDVTVTVTMGGVDITDQVYADGKVMISAVTSDVVITAKGAYNADGRLQQLPENYCCDTNLWTALDPVNEYYTASGWGNNSNSNYSVTFSVTPGDQICATSFGAAGTNGYSANAVRITWFGEDGVLKSLGRDVVYAEFAEYGYITVPEGAVAVNIPMASNADTWEIYILNRDHTYENGICTGCGEAQPGPVITQQPVNGEAKLGERYCITVEAEGEGLTYQWYIRNAGSKRFSKSSVKDNTYDDVMTAARAGREVYCVITDANGNSVTTEIVKLVLLPSEELAIVTQPTDGEAVLGERYCVTVEAKGEGLRYQWYFRNPGATRWTKSSVTDNTYDDIMNNTRNGREVYCVITDKFGNSVTTDIVKLVRVPMKLEIVSQPTDAEAAFGEMFCATVVAKGEGLKYQWYYRNAGTETWHKSGVRDNTYDDVMTRARNGREVYCVITDKYGNSVTTDTVKLIAIPSVELKLLGVTYEAAAMGERYCVTLDVQGEGLTYQWYFRNAGATRWSKSSVRDNTYDDVMNRTRANREVYCVITDAFGKQITTEVITLTVEK